MQIQANDSVRALSVDLSKHQVHRADDGDRVRQERAAHHEVGSSQVCKACRAKERSACCGSAHTERPILTWCSDYRRENGKEPKLAH